MLKSGNCVAVIGSGPSIGQYGDWTTLVNNLCQHCGITARVTSISSIADHLGAAEQARVKNRRLYHKFLGKHFGVVHSTNPLYDILMRIPFRGFMTLNFDPLLAHETKKPEHKCLLTHYPDLDRAAIKDRMLYYIHGLIEENTTPKSGQIVLSESEFAEAYGDTSMLPGLLTHTFTKDPVCFIGCRLSEPPLAKIFDICRRLQERITAMGGGKPPSKYILLAEIIVNERQPDGSIRRNRAEESRRTADESRQYAAMGIQVIRYDPIDPEHTGLRRLFEQFSSLTAIPDVFGFNRSGAHV